MADIAHSTAITFSSGFIAELTDINWSGISREAIETSHMGLAAAGSGKFGNRTFLPGELIDPGTLECEIAFDPDTLPPIAGAAETVTITWPLPSGQTTAGTFACSGFMTDFSLSAQLEGSRMTANVTIKLSGECTVTASS